MDVYLNIKRLNRFSTGQRKFHFLCRYLCYKGFIFFDINSVETEELRGTLLAATGMVGHELGTDYRSVDRQRLIGLSWRYTGYAFWEKKDLNTGYASQIHQFFYNWCNRDLYCSCNTFFTFGHFRICENSIIQHQVFAAPDK